MEDIKYDSSQVQNSRYQTVAYYFKVQNPSQISHDDFHDMFIYGF